MTEIADSDLTRLGAAELVLFDCDGTLLESEALMYDVQVRRFASLGIACSASELAVRYTGTSYAAMVADLSERHGVAIGAEIAQAIERDFRTRVGSELRPVTGARELLEAMPMPFCMASNAPRLRLIHMLRATGLLNLFGPRIVSAHDAGAAKPDPAVFLLAAELMGVAPSACLVVEDSLFGLTAAHAAGMRVAAYLGASHQTEEMVTAVLEARPDFVLGTLPDLLAFLPTTRRAE